ncbi:hypothetical protein [Oceanirhabdus sp. W0125-5]|uniref:hypothetical protein n=1 Tax=Oceanirhabdus sp. W0125-5 TaxID=2999116 RepID=UPI0022F2E383|nr:hypothetical protein [Oceanirhabdus sp. W0125-5]WBW95825.1 hypothetical protein OW730_19340 [Oceanirhabdus sp. W0125-5]
MGEYLLSVIGYTIINSPFIIWSLLMIFKTETMAKYSRYRKIESSEFWLAISKIVGVVLLIATIWCILTNKNMFMVLARD